MASLIEELIETLEEQNKIYETLLEIASKKKVAIIENNIPNLQEIVSQENTIVGRSLRLDKKRNELFDDMGVVLNKKNATLSDIIEAIKGQEGEKNLIKIKEKAEDILPKLKNLNDQNQELIQMSMDYVEYSMNLIRGGATGKPTYYDSAGNEINVSDKKMFDARQ
ncbi:MAG: flagellar protein FlgN [Eubacteriales bacterium]|nr:flagellar protein FlgN [Eubacteriales bacterium]